MSRKLFFPIIVLFMFLLSCNNAESKKTEAKNDVKKEKIEASFSDSEKADYIEKGISIAKNSGKTLKGKLQAAVKKGGLDSGIETCNKIAQKLMDSLSIVHGANIKRTSLKLRNLDDKPNQDELAVLVDFQKRHENGEKLKPVVKKIGGFTHFYAPIYVDDICLNCHGVIGEKLKPSIQSHIKELYPKDEAISYKKGDLRAIWSIVFNK